MAWSQTDIDLTEAAITEIARSGGAQTVRFSDGREVTYYSLSELLKVRDAMKSAVSSGSVRTTLMSFTKG